MLKKIRYKTIVMSFATSLLFVACGGGSSIVQLKKVLYILVKPLMGI